MKTFLKFFALALSIVLVAMFATSCSCFDYYDTSYLDAPVDTSENDYYITLPEKDFSSILRNTQVLISSDIVYTYPEFIPSLSQGGYVTNAELAVTILGYTEDFAYFNGSVSVTWTYNVISDTFPGGVNQTHTALIGLNPEGYGGYYNQLSFQGCRSVELISVDFAWSGTATKK